MVDNDRVAAALPSYEIGSELGRGACGVVLAGQHRQLGRLVAIKQLPRAFGADPAVRARFLAEARVLATLDHPHVVAIYDFVDHEGLCLLVMERLTGGTVWSRFHAGGFTPDVSCAILLAVCAGLHHAHQHGVLHRDVKPENLMFSSTGTLKVTDLGIAKVIGGSSTLATRHGEILGTPAYIAPEQAQGYELTPATDVYAAGTLLYELLAGRLPFPADADPATLLYRHVHEQPPPLLETAHAIPVDLAEVTDRAISKSPADRYQSAEAFGVAIAECAAKAWGRGWLGRTNVPVSASGPILTAALGEAMPGERTGGATAVESAQPTSSLQEPVAGDFLPIQLLHPEYRADDAIDEGSPEVAPPTGAPPTLAPQSAPPAPASSGGPAPATIVGSAAAPPAAAPASVAPVVEGAVGAPSAVDAPGGTGPVLPSAPPAPGGPSGGDAQGTKRRPLLLLIVALVVVAALVGGAVAISGGGKSHPPVTVVVTPPNLWKTVTGEPTARQQVASAELDGKLWIAGGLTDDKGDATDAVESYDPKLDKWTPEPHLPAKLHHAMAVAYNHQLVVMGGWVASHGVPEYKISANVYMLNDTDPTPHWVKLAQPMPHPRAAGAAGVVATTSGEEIIVAGGQETTLAPDNHTVEQRALVPQTEIYNFDTGVWHDGASIKTPRDHLGGVSDGTYFYAVGGRNLSSSTNMNTLEQYDPAHDKWTSLAPMPLKMGDLGATIVGGQIVTAGGELPGGVSDEVEAYSIANHTWSPLPPLKTNRHGLALLDDPATNKLFAIDGAAARNHTDSVNVNEALDLSSFARPSAWVSSVATNTGRDQPAAAVVGGALYVAGGLTDGGRATDEAESWSAGDASGWSDLGSGLPTAVHDAMAVGFQNELVVLGGWVSTANKPDVASDLVYQLQGTKWVPLPSLHHARANGAAAVVGDEIVVTGGVAKDGLVRQTEVFDGKTRKWHDVAQMPTLRDELAGAADDRYFYAVGGRLAGGESSGAVERYDTTKNTWQPLTGLLVPRSGLGATVVDDHLVVAGGENTGGVCDTDGVCGDVEAFNLTSKTWLVLPPMKTARANFGFLQQASQLYAIDGTTTAPRSHPVSTSEVFSWSTATP